MPRFSPEFQILIYKITYVSKGVKSPLKPS